MSLSMDKLFDKDSHYAFPTETQADFRKKSPPKALQIALDCCFKMTFYKNTKAVKTTASRRRQTTQAAFNAAVVSKTWPSTNTLNPPLGDSSMIRTPASCNTDLSLDRVDNRGDILPVSMRAMVTRATPDLRDRSCWVQFRAVRAVLIDVITLSDWASIQINGENDIYYVVYAI